MKLIKKKPDVTYTANELTKKIDILLQGLQLEPDAFKYKYKDFELPEELAETHELNSNQRELNVFEYIILYISENKLEQYSTCKYVIQNTDELIESFMNIGADMGCSDLAAHEALLLAAKNGCVSGVIALLRQGVSPMTLNNDGKTAIDLIFECSEGIKNEFEFSYFAQCAELLTQDEPAILAFMCKKFKEHPLTKVIVEQQKIEKQKEQEAAHEEKTKALAESDKLLKLQLAGLGKEINDLKNQVQTLAGQMQVLTQNLQQHTAVAENGNRKTGLFHRKK